VDAKIFGKICSFKKIYNKKFQVWVKGSKKDQKLKILPNFFLFEFPINFGPLNPPNIFLNIYLEKYMVFF